MMATSQFVKVASYSTKSCENLENWMNSGNVNLQSGAAMC